MSKFSFEEMASLGILDKLLDSSFDGIGYTNENGVVVYANKAYTEITGVDISEVLGKNISELAERHYPISLMAIEAFNENEPTSMSFCYKEKSDSNVLLTNSPVYDSTGTFRGIITNIRDINILNELSQQKKHNEILQNRINELELKLKGDTVLGNSTQMRKLANLAFQIANSMSTVLITGESGVGKDVYARLIHNLSKKSKPYIKVSCSAIPEQLFESELFGYEQGAFTGANKSGKPGIFELAKDGIIFLDEIGEMPLFLQSKLLTVLQDRYFMRVGGIKKIEIHARIIAATNRNLKEEVKLGRFREDLYYRLNVLPVYIPPLRERKDDIIPLAINVLNKLNVEYKKNKVLNNELQNVLINYNWPGNIRELNNLIERLYVFSNNDVIDTANLPDELKILNYSSLTDNHMNASLKDIINKIESTIISEHLKSDATLNEICKKLGISMSTLQRKINNYNLPKRYNKESN